jgi:hypothetical protein
MWVGKSSAYTAGTIEAGPAIRVKGKIGAGIWYGS